MPFHMPFPKFKKKYSIHSEKDLPISLIKIRMPPIALSGRV